MHPEWTQAVGQKKNYSMFNSKGNLVHLLYSDRKHDSAQKALIIHADISLSDVGMHVSECVASDVLNSTIT